jgi:hypothetical protein
VERVRELASDLSEPGFRVTVYTKYKDADQRLKVEISGGREKTKHAWKIAKTCDTEDEAIAYIKNARRAFQNTGGRK